MPPRAADFAVPWLSRTLDPPADTTDLRRRIAENPHAAMLESVAQNKTFGRFSIYAWDPVHTIHCRAGETPRPPGAGELEDPFVVLRNCCRPWAVLAPEPELPFVGGWIGFLAYEAGRFAEPKAGWKHAATSPVPAAFWQLLDTVLIHDRLADQWIAAGVDLPRRLCHGERPSLIARLDAIEYFVHKVTLEPTHRFGELLEPRAAHQRRSVLPTSLRSMGKSSLCALHSATPHSTTHPEGNWSNSRGSYLEKVERVLEYIRAGDIFQANLARSFRARLREPAFALYDRLCRTNPAAYAAFLNVPDETNNAASASILSSSPELFLSLRHGRVTTRPIKGTRPRGRSEAEDIVAEAALAGSDKDRAELNMIIDLERNDLGRVCEFGSVRVLDDGAVERHPTVLHRTASITGRLRAEADAIDLLLATFPGGSITGAPKVRAMQIIDELEAAPRGAYCGAIGYIGLDGDMQLNLAIRTMSVYNDAAEAQVGLPMERSEVGRGRVAELHVGSGIVADSDPEDECRELDAKAAGMLAALGCTAEEP